MEATLTRQLRISANMVHAASHTMLQLAHPSAINIFLRVPGRQRLMYKALHRGSSIMGPASDVAPHAAALSFFLGLNVGLNTAVLQ